MEKRNINSEIRSQEGNKLSGYAALFDCPADIGSFMETIDRKAFNKTLSGDIRALLNHDSSLVLGRNKSGTLRLSTDETGLKFEIDLPDTQAGRDIKESVRRGDVSGCSFGFRVIRDQWNDNTRKLLEVELFEISICTFPAYTETTVNLRKKGTQKMQKYNKKQDLIDDIYFDLEDLYKKSKRESLSGSENIRMNKLSNQWDESCQVFGLPTTREVGLGGLVQRMTNTKPDEYTEEELEELRAAGVVDPKAEKRKIPMPDLGTGKKDDRSTDIKGYELRGPGQDKTFRSLYGPITDGEYRWVDKTAPFFRTLFSGRFHPDLTKRGMSEGIAGDGGFLVPVEYSEQIHNVSLENEIIAPRAFIQPMKSNEMNIPAMTIGNHSSSLYGGFTATYKPELGTLTEANPTTRLMSLKAKKLTGFLRFSNELLADAVGGEKQILNICGKGLSWFRDRAFLKGSGAGQPLGILNAPCTLTQAAESGQSDNTIMYQNLTKMMAKCHGASFGNSVWIIHQTCIPQLMELSIPIGTGGSHVPVLTEANGQFKILTRPVIFTEKTEPLGTRGDIILADLSQYVIGLRSEMRIDLSQHLYFSTDEAAARLIERHDAQPLWDSALTLEDGSTQVSPFVVLAAR